MKTKTCSRPTCRKTKPLTDFYRDRTRSDGRRVECKECSDAHTNMVRAREREAMKNKAPRIIGFAGMLP